MNRKFCRKKKKTLVDPHQKKTNCLFSLEESISCESTGRGRSELPEEWEIILNHLLDTENQVTETLSATNAMNKGITRATVQSFKRRNLKKKFFKENKKSLMATWDDADSYEVETESEDERANIALMARVSDDTR